VSLPPAATAALVAGFAGCLAVVVYVYFGYPLLLWLLARRHERPVARGPVCPSLTLLVPAHNEEGVIADKVTNCLGLDYPADRLEVLVISDGSTDGTEAEVRLQAERWAAAGRATPIRLLALPRSGKAAALNAGAAAATGEVLVLTDANSLLSPDALVHLVAAFADPEVGGVCGNKRYRGGRGADATELGENLYWRYDKWQKSLESRLGSIFAADGALYALRGCLFVPIADPAQADDIAVSARVVLEGYRLVYEPRAVAWEEAPAEGTAELRRKIRVTNHSVRALLRLGRPLWTSGFYSLELVSHKLVRHLVPFFLLPMLAALLALGLAPGPARAIFAPALVAHVGFYGLAAAGFALRRRAVGRWRLLSVPYYFTLVNTAAFLGVLSVLAGRRLVAWTPRSGLATTSPPPTGGEPP
jgi:cellulose synthase/poly-beta-1,6-N-acetylglucosamine synthase-like glycosyltransferase